MREARRADMFNTDCAYPCKLLAEQCTLDAAGTAPLPTEQLKDKEEVLRRFDLTS